MPVSEPLASATAVKPLREKDGPAAEVAPIESVAVTDGEMRHDSPARDSSAFEAASPMPDAGAPPRDPALADAARAFTTALRRESAARARGAAAGIATGTASTWVRLRTGAASASTRALDAAAAMQSRLARPAITLPKGPPPEARPPEAPAVQVSAPEPPRIEPPRIEVAPIPPRARRLKAPGSGLIRRGWRLALGIVAGLALGALLATAFICR